MLSLRSSFIGFALLMVFAVACSVDKNSVPAVDNSSGTRQTSDQSTTVPVYSRTEPQSSSSLRSAYGCLGDPQLWSFDPDMSAVIDNQAGSIEGHIAQSPLIITGQLVQQFPNTIKGTTLLVKTLDAIGLQEYDRVRLEWIWVPGTLSVSGILGSYFVAFLSGDEIQYSNRHTGLVAWVVHPEGLWIECDGEATSVGVGPDGLPRLVQLDDPMTLDELWHEVTASGMRQLNLWWYKK